MVFLGAFDFVKVKGVKMAVMFNFLSVKLKFTFDKDIAGGKILRRILTGVLCKVGALRVNVLKRNVLISHFVFLKELFGLGEKYAR